MLPPSLGQNAAKVQSCDCNSGFSTGCAFYGVSRHRRCHEISRQTPSSYAIKLPCLREKDMRDVYILISLRMEPDSLSESLAHTYRTAMHHNPEKNITFKVVSIPGRGTCSVTGCSTGSYKTASWPLTPDKARGPEPGLRSRVWTFRERPCSILGRFVFLIPSTQMPGQYLQTGHDHFISQPFQSITQQQSYHLTPQSVACWQRS